MAKYEVFIPAANAGEFNVTLRVEAENWMAALKTGLKKTGERGDQVHNIMVDIMDDNSIHVTDVALNRVFRIKELEDVAAAPQPQAPAPAPAAAAPIPLQPAPIPLQPAPIPLQPAPIPLQKPAPVEPEPVRPAPREERFVPAPAPVEPPRPVTREAPKARPVEAKEPAPVVAHEPPKAKPAPKPAPKAEPAPAPVEAKAPPAKEKAPAPKPAPKPAVVEQVAAPEMPVSGPIGRSKSSIQLEDIFSDLFERSLELQEHDTSGAMEFLLDLALEKIPADAGSVFISDLASYDLELASARGPVADDLKEMGLRVPVGVGIVGFCAQEAVSLAISDTEKDPRFYREVSDKVGYPAKSILCAPMVSHGRTFGCIEIINKKGTSHFTDSELAILGYIAHQGAEFLERQA